MKSFIIISLFISNFVFAEIWKCEISYNDNRGNINEQKIYIRNNNYFLKSSQFGDTKLLIQQENKKNIILRSIQSNNDLRVALDKKNQTFTEEYKYNQDNNYSKTYGSCSIIIN
jgi:hypothetical protein